MFPIVLGHECTNSDVDTIFGKQLNVLLNVFKIKCF